jgi:hypothetical protein
MKFLYPEFLFALFALAIPIIIHLFNFRKYKRVLFTNVAFLREVQEKTQASQKLKHLLVLLSRLLFLTFLIMAFAQPVIPRKDAVVAPSEKVVSIFVDNSFSMQGENDEGSLLLQALEVASEVAESYRASADFQLLTHNFEARHQRLVTQEEFKELLEEIQISPQSKSLSEIISRQSDLLNTNTEKDRHLFVISDFQQSMCDFEALKIDSGLKVTFIPLATQNAQNIYIDSLWFSSPVRNFGQQEKLSIRIRNHSNKTLEDVPMSLWINNNQAAIGTFNLQPFAYTDTVLYFSNDFQGVVHGHTAIDDYPVTFDDRFYFSYRVDSAVKVMEILAGTDTYSNTPFNRIFNDDPLYRFTQTNLRSIDFSFLKDQDFIIVNEADALSSGLAEELIRFADNGGGVFLIPGAQIDANSYNYFTERFLGPAFGNLKKEDSKVNFIDSESPFFADMFERIPKNIDLPSTIQYYQLQSKVVGSDRVLMRLRNGDAFLSQSPVGLGNIYVTAVPLNTENNNFARHALFVTTVLRMSELSRPTARISYNLNEETPIATGNRTPAGNDVFQISSADGKFEMIPEYRNISGKGYLFVKDQISEAGNYNLKLGNELIAGASFNYPRKESKLDYVSASRIEEQLNNFGISNVVLLQSTGDSLKSGLLELETGKKLWKRFLIFALLFVLVEVALLKFWK